MVIRNSIRRGKKQISAARLAPACEMEVLEVRRLMTVYNPAALPLTPTEGTTPTVTVATFTSPSPAKNLSGSIAWGGVATANTTAGTISAIGTEFVPGIGNVPEYAVTTSPTFGDSTGVNAPSYTVSIMDSTDGTLSKAISTVQVLEAPLSLVSTNPAPGFTEGLQAVNFPLTVFHDGNDNATAADFSASINWGDGSTSTATSFILIGLGEWLVGGTHTYTQDGTIPGGITITTTDVGYGGTTLNGTTGPVTVHDAALSNGTPAAAISATEGQGLNNVLLGTFKDANPLATAADFSASVDWGDGVTNDIGAVSLIGGDANGTTFGIYGNHTYTVDSTSPQTIKVTVADVGGSTLPTITTSATVSDPLLQVAGGYKFKAVEGTASDVQTVATFVDPAGADAPASYPATIDWGDGNSSAGTVSFAGGFFSVQGSHTYTEESAADHAGSSQYILTVTLDHVPGLPQTVTSTAVVTDPSVAATADFSIKAAEGAALSSVSVATFTDPGGAEAVTDYSATIDWGDGTAVDSSAAINFAAGTFTVLGAHTYGEEGTYIASVRVSHEASTPQIVTDTIAVSDPAVSATGGFSLSAVEGTASSMQAVATFTDPGGIEPNFADPAGTIDNHYSATIDWGDGSSTTAGVLSLAYATITVLAPAHTYAEEGSYPVTVTVDHEATTPQTVTSTATVADAQLNNLASGNLPATGVENASIGAVTGIATFTDPAGPETGTAAIAANGATESGSTVTITTTAPIHLIAGQQVTIAGVMAAGYNGTFTVTSAGPTSFTYTNAATGLPNSGGGTVTGPADYTATINWGDGMSDPGTIVPLGGGNYSVDAPAHTYAEEGTYKESVTLTHDALPSVTTPTQTIKISDAPLMASGQNLSGKEGRLVSGTVATFSDGNIAAPTSDFKATITWGDGKTSTGAIVSDGAGNFHVTGSHMYAEQSSGSGYALKVTIKDIGGSTASATGGHAKIADSPLDSAAGLTLNKSKNVTYTDLTLGSFRDQDSLQTLPADYKGTIDWGDGSAKTTAKFAANGSTYNVGSYWKVQGTHKYTKTGVFTVKITVIDAGAPLVITAKITVT